MAGTSLTTFVLTADTTQADIRAEIARLAARAHHLHDTHPDYDTLHVRIDDLLGYLRRLDPCISS